jgi:hypothetical protein
MTAPEAVADEYLQLIFSNVFKRLPANAPSEHAHIIDMKELTPKAYDHPWDYDIKLPDTIVTALHNISPNTLEEFLDAKIMSFQIVQSQKSSPNCKVVVWRQGNQVLVSHHNVVLLNHLRKTPIVRR